MSHAAATNPYAWFQEPRSAEFLTEPRSDNRMIAYPYTKHMVSIIDVDIFASVLVTSEGWADAQSIPRGRRIYPWSYCYAQDPIHVAVRGDLSRSPAMVTAVASRTS